jgi:hypothetical protein
MNGYTIAGFLILGIPIGIAINIILYGLIFRIFAAKPNQKDLVGVYHIVETTNIDFDVKTYNQYRLEFNSDSSFILSDTPYLELCDSGKYEVDYTFDGNEINLNCYNDNVFRCAHIDRHFGSYRIEFVIGDPDSGESIYFKKDR